MPDDIFLPNTLACVSQHCYYTLAPIIIPTNVKTIFIHLMERYKPEALTLFRNCCHAIWLIGQLLEES